MPSHFFFVELIHGTFLSIQMPSVVQKVMIQIIQKSYWQLVCRALLEDWFHFLFLRRFFLTLLPVVFESVSESVSLECLQIFIFVGLHFPWDGQLQALIRLERHSLIRFAALILMGNLYWFLYHYSWIVVC